MYESFFGLQRRPFAALPRVEQYYPAAAIEGSRQAMARCIERGEGPAVVIGPTGTGKTLLCQVLAKAFQTTFRVAVLARGHMNTRRSLLQAILYELGQPYRGMDEGELRLALIDYLSNAHECPRGMLLIVDEAHTLPLRLLDELRGLTNLSCDGQPRVRLVLAGSGALEERLASPKLDSFSQRIVLRCYLESLNRGEAQAYIHAQIQSAGGQPERIFPHDACHAVHRAADGVPRLMNQLCDHALLLAFSAKCSRVDVARIEEAWSDLQQLPTPWNAESKASAPAPAASVVEFGGLDDSEETVEAPAEPAPATVPMLRLRVQEDESGREQAAPTVIASHEWDDDLTPDDAGKPEVELVLNDPGDPFSEPFVEEELVVDRYAPQPRDVATGPLKPFQPLPVVSAESPPAKSNGIVDSEELVIRIDEPDLEPIAGGTEAVVAPAAEASASPGDEADSDTLRMDQEADPADAEQGDSEIIIIDDTYDDMPPPPARVVTPVRNGEYRRLFTKLRGE